ncbi:unnamed protein product [Lupinus luteus]|uniref:C4-type zinc-finger of DNA polymerase delta domain-containing protein n=1 Tax=Lupinus luteus TaxID=3873 RepID=A0AAV1W1B9_LUPLU
MAGAAVAAFISKTSKLEQKMQHLVAICHHCGGGDMLLENSIKCTSISCSVFYERRKIQKELLDATHNITKKKLKKKAERERNMVPMQWQEKKQVAEKEEDVLRKEIEEFKTWVNMIETMNDQQLQGYIKNHQGDSKMANNQKIKKKAQAAGKSKPSISAIMASVWKFHKK